MAEKNCFQELFKDIKTNCVLDLFAYVSIVLYYMCMHVLLPLNGEV